MRDPVSQTRRELALRYATRGTTLQLARAVTVLELTGGADYSPVCRHAITGVTVDGAVICQVCEVSL